VSLRTLDAGASKAPDRRSSALAALPATGAPTSTPGWTNNAGLAVSSHAHRHQTPAGSAASGRPPPAMTEDGTGVTAWYEQLREQNRPDQLEVLLIGESPPNPGDRSRRFFYAPTLRIDNLYRGIALVVYGHDPRVDLADKQAVLRRLQAAGFWLIDAVDRPVNHLPPGPRRAAITAAVPRLIARCCDLKPHRGVVICHRVVYQLTVPSLRAAGVPVLHDQPLPFPLGNWRAEFVAGFRSALA